jgi:hypothetical protein
MNPVFRRNIRVVRVLWACLVVSTLLVALVAFLVPPGTGGAPNTSNEVVLGIVALAVAVASFVLPERVALGNVRRLDVAIQPANQATGEPARFADPTRAARRAMGIGQTIFILGMALSEVPSLCGLCMHMLGAPMAHALPLMALGTLLAASRFPTVARLVEPFERKAGATFASSEGG